jgi:Protein of unknown function (DUF2459)
VILPGRAVAALLLGVSLVTGCASAGRAGTDSPDRHPAMAGHSDFAPATLYLVRRRWHIDVGFAADALREPLAGVARQFPGSRYVLFGFGDRHYLLAKRHDARVLAALWPGPALILVTALSNSPQQAFGATEVIELPLAPEQSQALQEFIEHSLSRSAAGTLEPAAPGPYEGSMFFAAVPRYSAMHTCITWAAEALRAGGFPVRSRFVLVAGQLWRQALELHASIAGRRVSVFANDSRTVALRDHDGGLGGRGRTAAADAASQ